MAAALITLDCLEVLYKVRMALTNRVITRRQFEELMGYVNGEIRKLERLRDQS